MWNMWIQQSFSQDILCKSWLSMLEDTAELFVWLGEAQCLGSQFPQLFPAQYLGPEPTWESLNCLMGGLGGFNGSSPQNNTQVAQLLP